MKMQSMTARFAQVLALLAATVVCAAAAAQDFPSRAVRIVIPFPPGGTADILARTLAPKLQQAWGQQVLIDNRPGANTIIGAEHVAKSAPDGYTLLLTIDSTLAINPGLYASLPYDAARDFAPVTVIAAVPLLLVVHASVAATTVQELIALARAKPGAMNYASVGVGSPQQLSMELLMGIPEQRDRRFRTNVTGDSGAT